MRFFGVIILTLPCVKRSGLLGLVVRHGYVRFDPCTFLRQRRLQFSEWLGLRSHVAIPAMEFCESPCSLHQQLHQWSSRGWTFHQQPGAKQIKMWENLWKNNNSRASGIQKLLPIVDFFQVQSLSYLFAQWKKDAWGKKVSEIFWRNLQHARKGLRAWKSRPHRERTCVQLLPGPRVSCQSVADLGCCP